MLEARNARRARRGEPPVDVEEELAKLTAPRFDAELEAEIRQLVIARNYRRTRAGQAGARRRRRGRAGDPAARRALARRSFWISRFRVLCPPWPTHVRFEIDELVNRPGTYFNPQTEVLVVVDDSTEMDAEIFNMEEFEGADWVLISDDLPVDETEARRAARDLPGPLPPGWAAGDDDTDEELEEDDQEVGRE